MSVTHGGSRTRLYGSWQRMMYRCSNPKNERYGGRGIRVHAAWHDFATFRVWVEKHLGELPPRASIDRIGNDGNYEPGNIRFSTAKQQARNRRSNRRIVHPVTGESLLLCEWAERLKIKPATLCQRLNRYGWTIEEALSLRADSNGGWLARRARGS